MTSVILWLAPDGSWLHCHAEVVSALLSGTLTIAGIVIAAYALYLNLWRPRLEVASTLLYSWNKDLDPQNNRSTWLLRDLVTSKDPLDQLGGAAAPASSNGVAPVIERVFEGAAVRIASRHYDAVYTVLSKGFAPERLPARPWGNEDGFWITAEQSFFIRFQWMTWFNKIEAILTAWDTGAADPRRMGMVFGPLIESLSPELGALKGLPGIRTGLPLLFGFHDQLTNGKPPGITVHPELQFIPRWLKLKRWRSVTWRPQRGG